MIKTLPKRLPDGRLASPDQSSFVLAMQDKRRHAQRLPPKTQLVVLVIDKSRIQPPPPPPPDNGAPSHHYTMGDKAEHKRLSLTITTTKIPNYMFNQISATTETISGSRIQDSQIMEMIVKSRADLSDAPLSSVLIGYDPEEEQNTLYSEPFDSVETMLVEFTNADDTMSLLRHLFSNERLVTKSIVIIGPCRLKFAMEQHLDIFLAHNRVWEIETRSDEICGFGDTSNRYGILSLLTMVVPAKYKFFRDLDARQYQTSPWRKLYQPEKSLNNDAQCSNVQVVIGEVKDRGMTSSIHQIAFTLTQAMIWNRMFILEDTIFQFAYHWEELFLTASSCPLPNVVNLTNPMETVQQLSQSHNPDLNPRVVRISFASMTMGGYMANSIFPIGYFLSETQFRGHVMGYLLRQSTVMRKIIHDLKKDMFGSQHMPRCVALHVRNGDKLIETTVRSLDYYIDRMAGYNVGYNFTDVFIMSDNATVLLDSTLAFYPRYNFHKINLDRYNGVEAVADLLLKGTGNRFEAGATIVAEMTLASECDFFFGTLSSNVGRSVIELMIASNPKVEVVNWLSVDGSSWVNHP
eukprot:gene21341-25634_t